MLLSAVPSRKGKQTILRFLRTIKPQKPLDIPEDTTEYLMRGTNGTILLERMRNVESGINIVYHDLIEI